MCTYVPRPLIAPVNAHHMQNMRFGHRPIPDFKKLASADEAKDESFNGSVKYAAIPLVLEQLIRAAERLVPAGLKGGLKGAVKTGITDIFSFFNHGIPEVSPPPFLMFCMNNYFDKACIPTTAEISR